MFSRRPSPLALWVVAALIAAAMTGAWFIPRDTPRDKVTRYIERANATGTAFTTQYSEVSSAYRSFTLSAKVQPAQQARLQSAARRLTQLRVELQQIPAPSQARGLRQRLIALYRRRLG